MKNSIFHTDRKEFSDLGFEVIAASLRSSHDSLVSSGLLTAEIVEMNEGGEMCKVHHTRTSETSQCISPILVISPDNSPTTFISGSIHGDERVGPTVVAHIAEFLASNKDNSYIQWLLSTRRLLLAPYANVYGYANDEREDFNGVDPNRDFSFDSKEKECFRTPTARVIAKLYELYDIDITVTFHGGMRALTYGWGNFIYLDKSHRKAWRTPDTVAMSSIANRMQKSSGKAIPSVIPSVAAGDNTNNYFYPIGTISDVVYPLRGGMEDWTYAAGWQCQLGYDCNVQKACHSTTNALPRSLTYLVETDDLKNPPDHLYGQGMNYEDPARQLHVARNAILAMVAFESSGPPLLNVLNTEPSSLNTTSITAMGCTEITSLILVEFEEVQSNQECQELTRNWLRNRSLSSGDNVTLVSEWNAIVPGEVAHPHIKLMIGNSDDSLSTYPCARMDQILKAETSELPTIELVTVI
eukprot:GHVH01007017.1.p1 GENE.GHVH01007017.1~~GHVH01007017.1.p1  ORF type:complete len:468 (+),score=57.07 GHVH01007017.1:69-1472(+)